MKAKVFFLSIILLGALSYQGYSQSDSLTTNTTADSSKEAVETTTTTTSTNRDDQFQTLFGSSKGFGGYFGLVSHYSEFNNQGALLLGAEISAVINHSFNIGFKGYGSVTKIKANRSSEYGQQLYIGIGYGGINLEPVVFYNSVVHLSFPILFGGGGIAEYSPYYYGHSYNHNYYYEYNYDYFFVLEPGVNLEVNLLKFMKLSTGASYRVSSAINVVGYDGSDLNGFNFDLSLKFGWF